MAATPAQLPEPLVGPPVCDWLLIDLWETILGAVPAGAATSVRALCGFGESSATLPDGGHGDMSGDMQTGPLVGPLAGAGVLSRLWSRARSSAEATSRALLPNTASEFTETLSAFAGAVTHSISELDANTPLLGLQCPFCVILPRVVQSFSLLPELHYTRKRAVRESSDFGPSIVKLPRQAAHALAWTGKDSRLNFALLDADSLDHTFKITLDHTSGDAPFMVAVPTVALSMEHAVLVLGWTGTGSEPRLNVMRSDDSGRTWRAAVTRSGVILSAPGAAVANGRVLTVWRNPDDSVGWTWFALSDARTAQAHSTSSSTERPGGPGIRETPQLHGRDIPALRTESGPHIGVCQATVALVARQKESDRIIIAVGKLVHTTSEQEAAVHVAWRPLAVLLDETSPSTARMLCLPNHELRHVLVWQGGDARLNLATLGVALDTAQPGITVAHHELAATPGIHDPTSGVVLGTTVGKQTMSDTTWRAPAVWTSSCGDASQPPIGQAGSAGGGCDHLVAWVGTDQQWTVNVLELADVTPMQRVWRIIVGTVACYRRMDWTWRALLQSVPS